MPPTSPLLDRRSLLVAAGVAAPLAALPGAFDRADALVDTRTMKRKKAPSDRVLTMSGLYSWPQDYLRNREQMRGLSATTLRLASDQMDDAAWTAAKEDGYDTHFTLSTEDRSEFSSDEAWIANHVAVLDSSLRRWPFKWVEIMNEPNFSLWWDATPEQRQTAYGKLLVAAYRHVKNNFPGTGVVGFAAGGSSAAAPDFIRAVIERVPEAASSFDVLSMHPYIAPVAPEETKHEDWGSWSIRGQVKAVRELGVKTPIWFSEIGWEIAQSEGGLYSRDSIYTVSAEKQAAYTARMFILAMRLGVQRVHHMYVIDTDNYNGGFFGDSGARLQAKAMAYQQQVLRRPTAIRSLGDRHSGVHAHRVRTANGPVTVAWADGEHRLQVGRRATVRDLYGDPVRVKAGRVALTGSPVYVTGSDLGTAARRRRTLSV